MPPKGYVTLTVKEELAPFVRQYYQELLSGIRKPMISFNDEEKEVTLRIPYERYSELMLSLSRFYEARIDWIDPYEVLMYYIDACELLSRCRTLQIMAQKGMIRHFTDIFEKIILDADKLFKEQLDFRKWLTPFNIYSIPLAILLEVATTMDEGKNYRISAAYIASRLGLTRETVVFILSSLERNGIVKMSTVGYEDKGDVLIELTEAGKEIALLLLNLSNQLNWVVKEKSAKEVWWLNASVDLIHYWNKPGSYVARIQVGLDDAWTYLTETQKSMLEKYVAHTLTGTLFSREALEMLPKIGIKIPYLSFVLEKVKNLLVSAKEL
jgi:DNA-binding MarR family transcriptional regulator